MRRVLASSHLANDGTRGNGLKLRQRRVMLNIRKNLFMVRVVKCIKHRNGQYLRRCVDIALRFSVGAQ